MSATAGLWPFMLALYARPRVAETLLRLQETRQADVPLLLAVIYAARCGYRQDRRSVAAMDQACHKWREGVVWPLRKIRHEMKGADWIAGIDGAPALRDKIKQLEPMSVSSTVARWTPITSSLPSRWDSGSI